ncbi:unnamed protein product, partial [Hapterophycus canaliculatus]
MHRRCLQATHNTVFAHRAIIPLLRNVRSAAIATGLSLGARSPTLGNKGGVGISFDIGATSCVFVNSHLAAHQDNVRERNDHFFQISEGLARELEPSGLCGKNISMSGDRCESNVAGKSQSTEETPALACPSAFGRPPSGTTGCDGCKERVCGGGGGDDGGKVPSLFPLNAFADSKLRDGHEDQDRRTEWSPSCLVRGVKNLDGDQMRPDCTQSATVCLSQPAAPPSLPEESAHRRSREAGNDATVTPPKTDQAGVCDAVKSTRTPPMTPAPPTVESETGDACATSPSRRHGCQETNGEVQDMHEVLLNNEQLSLERDGGRRGGRDAPGAGGSAPFSGFSEG